MDYNDPLHLFSGDQSQALSDRDHPNSKRAALNGAEVRQFSHMVFCARAYAAETGRSRRKEPCIGHLRKLYYCSRTQSIVMARRGVSGGRIRRMLLANSDKSDSDQSAGEEEQVGAVAGADAIVAAGGSDQRNRGVAHSGKKCTLEFGVCGVRSEFAGVWSEFGRSLVGVWSEFATMCTRSSACEQPLDRNICCRHSIKSVRCQDCTESRNVSE